jgi:lysophospholipase L1-like esterase
MSLSALRQRLAAGNRCTIAYFGGSITEGYDASDPTRTSWRALTTAWFRRTYPQIHFNEVNASIGGTGSDLGAFRLANDVLPHRPDLVFIEFAVNDQDAPEDLILRGFEGCVRRLLRSLPNAALVVVLTTQRKVAAEWEAGRTPLSVQAHQRVAGHHGLPCINLAPSILAAVAKDPTAWTRLMPDNVHPKDAGFTLYAETVTAFLADWLAASGTQETASGARALPSPITTNSWERGDLLPAVTLKAPGWVAESESLAGRFPNRLASDTPGASVQLDFTGSTVGVYWLVSPDAGAAEWSIDEGPWQTTSAWDPYAQRFTRAHYRFLAADLAGGPHRLHLRVSATVPGGSTGRWLRIGAFLVER